MREFAYWELESEGINADPDTERAFDEEVELASEGRWEELGLDAP